MNPSTISSNALQQLQDWLRSTEIAGLVIPSTDEFLSEFAPPANRRLEWATGFRGSTGVAVVLRDAAGLFLDGRYLQQAREEIDPRLLDTVPAIPAERSTWLRRHLQRGMKLGLDPWLHAALDQTLWQQLANEVGFQLQLLDTNPVDALWTMARPSRHEPLIVDYPICFAGERYEDKCAALGKHVAAAGLQALLLGDPEDVSWLLNVRAAGDALCVNVGDWHIVPTCTSRALVDANGRVTWFVEPSRLARDVLARSADAVQVAPPAALSAALGESAVKGPVGADLRRTPAALCNLIVQAGGTVRDDDSVARSRWRKHPAEVESARKAHVVDAAAVVKLIAWLVQTVPQRIVTEFEVAQRLQELRAQHSAYIAPSMPAMAASGLSGAQPHYVPRRHHSRRLNDHPIFWLDSGGQYLGGSTDNTITLALGRPEPSHVLAHTLVLQGFISLATARAPAGTYGFRLDPLARQALWRHGMDYPHGTGHGVGNYLNIHEGPAITREPTALATVPLEPGMIVTNEPGYYLAGDFGLRIECHMVVVQSAYPGFIEFDVVSRLPIDPQLVDFERLTPVEREWLADYHCRVWRDLEPLLDEGGRRWLRTATNAFSQAAGNRA
jgi:Xaa-Pro aminopeptidase